MRKDYVAKYLGSHSGANKDEAKATLEGNLDYQAKELELKRKYKDRLLQVISAQQLEQLYVAERDFRKMLLDRLRNEEK